jgi:hypothetical protein
MRKIMCVTAAIVLVVILMINLPSVSGKVVIKPYPKHPLGAEAIYDPLDNYIVMWDGDTWTYVYNNWTELQTATHPPGFSNACFVWDNSTNYGLLFGGQVERAGKFYESNYSYSFVHGEWANITSTSDNAPPSMEYVRCAYDAATKEVVMFGGHQNVHANLFMNETWVFTSNGKWKQIFPLTSPVASFGGEMFYDPISQQIILYGGRTGVTYKSEWPEVCKPAFCPYMDVTWTFSNNAWIENANTSNDSSPPGHLFGMVAWDYSSNYAVSFGGQYNAQKNYLSAQNATYTFSDGVWTNITHPHVSPPATFSAIFAYDPVGNYALLFGGLNSTMRGGTTEWSQTWLFSNGVWSNVTP